ncbi:NAD(P)/FAD-dependent oxidoreductase [Maricaulis sp. CAU 1757]
MNIAIIGAGMAGLACANRLSEAGARVCVFEKSRGLGGRLATRRSTFTTFDHGAQFVHARSDSFKDWLQQAQKGGFAEQWEPCGRPDEAESWWVGQPGMSALAKPLADRLTIQTGSKVVEILHGPDGWSLRFEGVRSAAGPFQRLVLAIPAPQCTALAGQFLGSGDGLDAVEYAPCWSVLLGYDPGLGNDVPDLIEPARGALSWVARNSSKPGRNREQEAWTLHASADWSLENLELDRDDVTSELTGAFAEIVGHDLPEAVHADAHRWLYARVTRALGQDAIWKPKLGLGLTGDWCLGARVEAAWTSGRALAQCIIDCPTWDA